MSLPARLITRLRPPYRLHSVYERLLGTEVELQIVAQTRVQAEHAEQVALKELERLTLILNRFDPHSELRRWLTRPGERMAISAELFEVLRLADHWRELSGGAFHPAADALGELWKTAAQTGSEPEPGELERVTQQMQGAPWTLHANGSATLNTCLPLGLNALAKGWIVDRMAEKVHAQQGVQAVLVNAGGDLRTSGGKGLEIMVANPFTARDDAVPLGRVHVQDAALATSGSAHRGYQVGETWYSHVLDPRTGWPVQDVPGVTVVAPTCATADALATILSVLPIQEGLKLVNATPGTAALIVRQNGEKHTSTSWAAL